jgi:hypothetical protein
MPPEASLDPANILRNLHVVSSRSYPQETADLDKVQRHASVNTTYLPCKHYLIFGDVTDAGAKHQECVLIGEDFVSSHYREV